MTQITSGNNTYTDYFTKNQALIQEYRQAFRLTAKDSVQIYVLPKGKAGNKAGSFVYKPLSGKAQRLIVEQNRYKRKIQELQLSDPAEGDKFSKLNKLRKDLRYVTDALNAEIASLPQSGFIVVEDDAEG